VVSNIHRLFISQILGDPDIKNFKIRLPIMLGASLFFLGQKISKRQHHFLKENILSQILLFLKKNSKNHKLIFKNENEKKN